MSNAIAPIEVIPYGQNHIARFADAYQVDDVEVFNRHLRLSNTAATEPSPIFSSFQAASIFASAS